jgi:hypothetical protein
MRRIIIITRSITATAIQVENILIVITFQKTFELVSLFSIIGTTIQRSIMEACRFLVFVLFLFVNNEGVDCKLGVEDKNPSPFIDGRGTRGHVFKEKIAGVEEY